MSSKSRHTNVIYVTENNEKVPSEQVIKELNSFAHKTMKQRVEERTEFVKNLLRETPNEQNINQ
jgi:hypothetical protein